MIGIAALASDSNATRKPRLTGLRRVEPRPVTLHGRVLGETDDGTSVLVEIDCGERRMARSVVVPVGAVEVIG